MKSDREGQISHDSTYMQSHGVLQARILEWVATPSSRGSSDPETEPASLASPALEGGFFTTGATWEATPSPPPYDKNALIYGTEKTHKHRKQTYG